MNSIFISIGKILIRFDGMSEKLRSEAMRRYGSFIINPESEEKPDVIFHITLTDKFVPGKPLDPVLKYDNGNLSIIRYDFEGIYYHQKALLDIKIFENIYSIDAILRIFYSYYLAINRGFLIHSAGIVMDEHAYVFCGETLHGKSNIAKGTEKGILLSDEITLIRKIHHDYYVFGTPFWGEFAVGGVNFGYKLEDLYFLHKGESNSLEDIQDIKAIQKLLSTILLFINDKKINDNIFDTAMDLISKIDCYRFTYNKKDDIWREIKYDRVSK